MKIKFLKAYQGDCIWISFLDNDIPRNIIIDGGVGDTYKDKLKRTGELFDTVKFIKENEQRIDLLILTHFDDDHIGGLLRWFNQEPDAHKVVEKVWFNSGKEISKKLEIKENEDLCIEIMESKDDFFTSIKQGIKFEDYLKNNTEWKGEIIKQGCKIELFGLKFKILSPNIENLKNLLKLYKKEEDYFTSAGEFDFETSLRDFIEEESNESFNFKEDKSVPNGSSIAFLMEYQAKYFLFLGDAYPSVIIEGLKFFGFDIDNTLEVELMKISHHGSKHNTNSEMLDVIKTNDYLISSNGAKHGLPNKRTISRIIKHNSKANIYFNYEGLIDEIFTHEDITSFEHFKPNYKTEFDY